MRVLVVNAGSSSLKLHVLDQERVVADHEVERWDDAADVGPVEVFLGSAGPVDAVGHRVVHGGQRYRTSVLIDDDVVADLTDLVALAPLHQPRALSGIAALRQLLPTVPQIACFDTAFHATLPEAAATYALPRDWQHWGIRRYGFHGLSHRYAATRAAELLGRPLNELRLVTCHLGAGASLCAVASGVSVDTTMGFTPLEGLVMATRSGNVDPGALLWLQDQAGLTASEVANGLIHRAGLAGLSGTSGDLRDVLAAVAHGDAAAQLAVDVFVHRLAGLIGQMAVAAGGVDGLVFTGGIGEHQPAIRASTAEKLGFLGVRVDVAANDQTVGVDTVISTGDAPVALVVVRSREELQIVREVSDLLDGFRE